jgi:hypothetical protein
VEFHHGAHYSDSYGKGYIGSSKTKRDTVCLDWLFTYYLLNSHCSQVMLSKYVMIPIVHIMTNSAAKQPTLLEVFPPSFINYSILLAIYLVRNVIHGMVLISYLSELVFEHLIRGAAVLIARLACDFYTCDWHTVFHLESSSWSGALGQRVVSV